MVFRLANLVKKAVRLLGESNEQLGDFMKLLKSNKSSIYLSLSLALFVSVSVFAIWSVRVFSLC